MHIPPGAGDTRRGAPPCHPCLCDDWLGSGSWPQQWGPDARERRRAPGASHVECYCDPARSDVLGRRRANGAIAATQRPARRVHVLGTAIRDEIDTTMLVR